MDCVAQADFAFGLRGYRKKIEVQDCECLVKHDRPCAGCVVPCVCVRRGEKEFAYLYLRSHAHAANSTRAPMTTQKAVYQSFFPTQFNTCTGMTTTTGEQFRGRYRIRYDTLRFVGHMLPILLDTGSDGMIQKIAISPQLCLGTLVLHLVGVACRRRNHYYGYGRVRKPNGASRWLAYDDLDEGGRVTRATGERPWEQVTRHVHMFTLAMHIGYVSRRHSLHHFPQHMNISHA